MALSFLGVWEIPIPGFVGSGTAGEAGVARRGRRRVRQGALTTVLATPCSGPFLGPVFGYTLKQPPAVTYLIFGCIGLGMASPYLLIGAFPQLIRFLPKPGAWMDTFKQMMGFVLLGTIVFLFTLHEPRLPRADVRHDDRPVGRLLVDRPHAAGRAAGDANCRPGLKAAAVRRGWSAGRPSPG